MKVAIILKKNRIVGIYIKIKIVEISGNRYCIFVKTDSVDIKKVSPDLYYFSGIYDKKNNIVLLVQHLMLFNEERDREKNILIS